MQGLTKSFPGGKKCFENIHLSFLPGVKIGVVGVNGAGKSSLRVARSKFGSATSKRNKGRTRRCRRNARAVKQNAKNSERYRLKM